jgi:RHS repeat-associated protein
MGKILTWQQQTDASTPLLWTEGYDTAGQLTSAVRTSTAMTSPALVSDSYGYDAAGNMTSSSLSGVARSPSYNSLNQLTSSTPSGSPTVRFTGTLNETATVTVNGSAATLSGTNFSGGAVLSPGSTNTVAVVAQDSHGNTRTNNYQTVVAPQPSYSPTYDADGNQLTNGAGQTYTWDAKSELSSITYTGGASTLFTYDALGRRIGIVEKNSGGTVTSTKQFVWDGTRLAEERNAGNTVTKRFFAQGEQISGASYFYTRDHLGSIREMTDSSGNIQARYDYDPYGRVTKISGSTDSDFQYAGYYEHATSGLNLTMFRAYDPTSARWLSRDPLPDAERLQGPNLYEYVMNDPLRFNDPLGLYDWGAFWQGASDFNAWQQSAAATDNGLLTLGGLAPWNGPFAIQPGNQYNQCASQVLGGLADPALAITILDIGSAIIDNAPIGRDVNYPGPPTSANGPGGTNLGPPGPFWNN